MRIYFFSIISMFYCLCFSQEANCQELYMDSDTMFHQDGGMTTFDAIPADSKFIYTYPNGATRLPGAGNTFNGLGALIRKRLAIDNNDTLMLVDKRWYDDGRKNYITLDDYKTGDSKTDYWDYDKGFYGKQRINTSKKLFHNFVYYDSTFLHLKKVEHSFEWRDFLQIHNTEIDSSAIVQKSENRIYHGRLSHFYRNGFLESSGKRYFYYVYSFSSEDDKKRYEESKDTSLIEKEFLSECKDEVWYYFNTIGQLQKTELYEDCLLVNTQYFVDK